MQPSNGIIPYGKHIGALLTLGIPIIIGQLGSIVQGLADTVMVGRFSAQALAAAGFVNNVMFLVLVSALGYSYALTPVVGPLHARKEYHKAGHALRAGLQVNGLLGAVLFFVMGSLYFCLDHMGQPEELLPEIRPYYLIVLLSLPLQTVFNGFKQFFDGVGRTREPMWIMLSANLLNIIGNWLFIYGIGPFPRLGLMGAGLSTLLSRLVMLAAISGLFACDKDCRKYHRGFLCRTSGAQQRRRLHRLGWPLGLQMGMETASFALCAVMQGWLGTAPLAAHHIMTNVGALCFMIYYGIGASVAIRVSHFHGTSDLPNIRRSAAAGYLLILTAGIVLSGSIAWWISDICAMFTTDSKVQHIVLTLTMPFVLYQFGDGLQVCFANSLRGIADVRSLMRYAFVSYILISLPLSYILGFCCHLGPAGIWMAYPVALTTAGVLFLRRFRMKTRFAAQEPR